MAGYCDSYYDSLSSSLYNLNGGGSDESNNLIMYVLIGILAIVVIYAMREMNTKYEKIIDNMNKQTETKPIQIPPNVQIPPNIQNGESETQKVQQNIRVNLHKDSQQIPQKTAFDLWREYDYRSLNDPLVAPRRRDDFNLPVLPLPTRGYPAAYKKVGMLVDKKANDNDRYKFLLLMGRNTHPGSYVFEYYAMENDKNGSLKFDVCRRGRQELQSDDKIRINELDRVYTVVMDRILGYEYDPYLF